MSSTRRKISLSLVLRSVGTLLALALMATLLIRQWEDITRAVREMEPMHFWGAFALIMASRLFVTLRWHVLLRGAQAAIPFKDSLRLTFAGLFSANFLPTTVGGDVVRLAGIITAGHGAALGTATLVMDRLIGMAGMAVLAPFGAARVLTLNAVAAFTLPLPTRLANRARRALQKLLEILRTWLRKPQALFASLGFTFLHMGVWFAAMAVLLDGLNDPMPYWLVAVLWSLVYFITQIPVSINGLGLQELSIAYIFATYGGVSSHNALVMGLVFRVLVALASLPGAFSLPGLLPQARAQTQTERDTQDPPL